ncbi:hypothetical protein D3C72_2155250 [compost metagenome]
MHHSAPAHAKTTVAPKRILKADQSLELHCPAMAMTLIDFHWGLLLLDGTARAAADVGFGADAPLLERSFPNTSHVNHRRKPSTCRMTTPGSLLA